MSNFVSNDFSSENFQLVIEKLPKITFNCQQVAIPDINLPPAEQANSLKRLQVEGDVIEYGEVTCEIVLDEDFKGYRDLKNWIEGLGFPEQYEQHTEYRTTQLNNQLRSDITVSIFTNNSNPKLRIIFKEAFPTSLSGPVLSTVDAQMPLTFSVSFATNIFTIEEI